MEEVRLGVDGFEYNLDIAVIVAAPEVGEALIDLKGVTTLVVALALDHSLRFNEAVIVVSSHDFDFTRCRDLKSSCVR